MHHCLGSILGPTIGPKGFIFEGSNNAKFEIELTIGPKGFIVEDRVCVLKIKPSIKPKGFILDELIFEPIYHIGAPINLVKIQP